MAMIPSQEEEEEVADSTNDDPLLHDDAMMVTRPVENEAYGPADDDDDDDDLVDDTPDFLTATDAVEVQVDHDTMPMEDTDDNDNETTTEVMIDMSRLVLASHTGPVYATTVFPIGGDNNNLGVVSTGGDDCAYFHVVDNSARSMAPHPLSHRLVYPHTDSVSCAASNVAYISSTSTPRLVAVGAYDGAIVLYDADTGALVSQLEDGPTDVEWVCFHPVGGTVFLAGSAADHTVWMYHIINSTAAAAAQPPPHCLQVFVGHEGAVQAGAFSPDGRWALSCSADGSLRVWAPKTGACRHVFRFGSSGLTCLGTQGPLVLVGAEDGQAHVCHIGTKKVVASLRHSDDAAVSSDGDELLPSSVEAVAFAGSNPTWCATGGMDGVLKVWDLANNAQCRHACRPDGAAGGITRIQWHPNLPVVFTSSTAGAVRLWDARNGQLLQTLTGGSAEVINDMSVQWLDGGKSAVVVTASDDGKVRIFDVNIAALMDSVLPIS
jgi:angio-associated migratory cell protein